MKILVVGSINVDSTTVTKKLPLDGQTVLADDFYMSPGGKGANQAVAAARLGLDVAMIGKVGDDEDGRYMLDILEKENIDISGISKSDKHTGLAQITIQEDGLNTIVVYPGANFDIKKEDIDANKDKILAADLIIMQLEIPLEIIDYVVDLAQENKIDVMLNPAPAKKLSKDLLEKITYLTPNETELEYITGIKDIDQASDSLLEWGVKDLVVTLGKDGSMWKTKDQRVLMEAARVDAIDTTAAGDSFHGGFALGLDSYTDKKEILKLANLVGALTTTKKGAINALPYREEVEKKLQMK